MPKPKRQTKSPASIHRAIKEIQQLITQNSRPDAFSGTTPARRFRKLFSHQKAAEEPSRIEAQLYAGTFGEFARHEFGIRRTTPFHKEIEKIAETVGVKKWNQLVGALSQVPKAYEEQIQRPIEIARNFTNQVKLCRQLAESLEAHNPSTLYQDIASSPIYGVVAKEIFRIGVFGRNLARAIEGLPRAYGSQVALDIAKGCLYPLMLVDPSTHLTKVLRAYADALERGPIDREIITLLSFLGRKQSSKEFAKRIVFYMLQSNWPHQLKRPPNKETALLVNIILNLQGRSAVTANDISQMNKSTRRSYYKEAKQRIARIDATKE
jgi:hypothetical protein